MEKPGFEDLIEDLAKPQKSLPELKFEAKRENASLPAEETAEPGGAEPAGERADQIESPPSPPHGETSATMVTDLSIPPVPKITAEHMRIEDWERKVMKKLFPLIPSPRAAKRFVNIYRLLRASVPAENLAEFVGDEEQGKHRAALALLAILIGYPSEATDIIQALLELEQEPGKKSRNVEWGRFFQRFDSDKSAGKRTAPGDGGQQAAEAERWRELKTKLKETGLIHERQQCDDFIEWAEEVARYSFQSGRVLLKSERKLQPAAEKSSV
jgi:hypothetical protein